MKKNQKRKNNKGFSLVELIIVIAIMAILAGILAPQFVKYINKGKVSTDIQNAQQMASALAVYYADHSDVQDTFTVVTKGTTATMPGKTDKISDVLGGTPEVKAETNKAFAFKISKEGKVTVWIVPATGATDGGTNNVELYPTQPTTGTWKAE